jgi:2-keto-4-pentenoate hydratase/2-oxohepta-3-ene-1,7-dioic acid hydratase in catechol pathway
MGLVRFKNRGEVNYGVRQDDRINRVTGEICADFQVSGDYYSLSEVDLLAPCSPSKIVCVGLNYEDHAKELDQQLPEDPVIFLKPATAVIGPEDKIKYPSMSEQVDYEAELAVVIKDKIKGITPQEADDHILGYTCFNDITARDLQQKDGQWTRAKSFDTFAPLGPEIATDVAPGDLEIKLIKNGVQQQVSNTSQMIFSSSELVSFISQVMTLQPGDIIATGTPPGVGAVEEEDQLTVEIEGIGSLQNEVESGD